MSTMSETSVQAGGYPALLLNADFQPMSYYPLSLLSWQHAVKGVLGGDYSVVAEYDRVVRSPSTRIALPSVVALRSFQRAPRRVAFTRFNLFLRDRFTCQYCGVPHVAKDLTFEHVVPRSRGGPTSWHNIVAACSPCNLKKGDRTDMKPVRAPREPDWWELQSAARRFPPNHLHETWLDYLYWDAELQIDQGAAQPE